MDSLRMACVTGSWFTTMGPWEESGAIVTFGNPAEGKEAVMILLYLIKLTLQALYTAIGSHYHMKFLDNNNSSSHLYNAYYMPGTVLNAFTYIKSFTLTKSDEVVTITIS